MKYVTLITIEEIYASALKGKLVRSAEGWERVEPVVPRENPTASPIINAIARALRERVFQPGGGHRLPKRGDADPDGYHARAAFPVIHGHAGARVAGSHRPADR